jgi:three-Cys-motif partner protein
LGHKASNDFFNAKLPWSKRKDQILRYYLPPYLNKVRLLRRPILLVDGFAGRGVFRDGEQGSPVIIAEAARDAIECGTKVEELCIEIDDELFAELCTFTKHYPFVDCRNSSFLAVVPAIERRAANSTVFLYIDPYTVAGLEWEALDSILRHIDTSQSSVELLLNFNAHAFARHARSVMKIAQPELDESTGDADSLDAGDVDSASTEKLNAIVGGDWWRKILSQRLDFAAELDAITNTFVERLRERFREVYHHQIKAHWRHTVPKYSLIFGSRSVEATRLMNDAIVDSRKLWADETAPEDAGLFETRPAEVVPDTTRLPGIVMERLDTRMPRGDLIVRVIQNSFGMYSETQIRQTIASLIKGGRIVSQTGRSRIPNEEQVWKA